jgi:two-component system OmpR family sensor kinase
VSGSAGRPAWTLRRRLAGALIVTAVVSLLLAALVGSRLLRRAGEEAALRELHRQAQAIAGEATLDGGEARPTLRLMRRALNLSDASLYRIGEDGRAVLAGGDPQLTLTSADIEELRAGRTLEGRRRTPTGEVLFAAEPFAGPRATLVLVLARPAGEGGVSLGPSILAAAGVAVAVAVGMSILLSKRIAGPMKELAAAARDLARGKLDRRVAVEADDEIAVVAEAFNTMAGELQADEQRQRDFLMSISHELRTPLTAIQGYAEAIEDGTTSGEGSARAAGVILGESKRLARLVSDLLDLARLDARRFGVMPEAVEVAPVLESVKSKFDRQAAESDVDLRVDACDATVMADPDRLVQILSNLVENALRYTPPSGRITLGCTGGEITVTDTGPGFHEEDLPRAFERQYLVGKYRGVREVGTGLGLVITRELAAVMGGTVVAANVPGGGARFMVALPAPS